MTDAPIIPAAFPPIARSDVFMIGTKRLWLRWPRKADAERLAAISGDPEVAARIASWPVGATIDYTADRIERMRKANSDGTAFVFSVTVRGAWWDSIGLIGIAARPDGSGMLGYHLMPEMWARGYATEAVAGILAMTRLLTRLDRITAGVLPANPASARVLVKNGFVGTGRGTLESAFRGEIAVDQFERALKSEQRPAGERRSAA